MDGSHSVASIGDDGTFTITVAANNATLSCAEKM
jgi:hypothetical protein